VLKVKGDVKKVLDKVATTTTSDVVNTSMFNAVYVTCIVGGSSGKWNIKLQGRLSHDDSTYFDLKDASGNDLKINDITASCIGILHPVPDMIKVVATEVTSGGNLTVFIQPINI
jgi:hypothetical protein